LTRDGGDANAVSGDLWQLPRILPDKAVIFTPESQAASTCCISNRRSGYHAFDSSMQAEPSDTLMASRACPDAGTSNRMSQH
jgi:hypothetical protein